MRLTTVRPASLLPTNDRAAPRSVARRGTTAPYGARRRLAVPAGSPVGMPDWPVVPPGAAFFDLDKTVIAKASVIAFSGPFYREGLLTRRIMARGIWAQLIFVRFGARAKTLDRLLLRMLRLTEGWEQERVQRIVADTLIQVVGPITYKDAVNLIAEHKAAGRRVYIVSAAPEEIVEPLARHLGAEEAIATRAAVKGGLYTGQLLSYAFGPQKAATIRQIAARDGLDLNESWAYSDSATDLPMLESVGHPVAVNPDRALRRIAQMRGWPVLHFSELTDPSPRADRSRVRANLVGLAAAAFLTALALAAATAVRRRGNGPATPAPGTA